MTAIGNPTTSNLHWRYLAGNCKIAIEYCGDKELKTQNWGKKLFDAIGCAIGTDNILEFTIQDDPPKVIVRIGTISRHYLHLSGSDTPLPTFTVLSTDFGNLSILGSQLCTGSSPQRLALPCPPPNQSLPPQQNNVRMDGYIDFLLQRASEDGISVATEKINWKAFVEGIPDSQVHDYLLSLSNEIEQYRLAITELRDPGVRCANAEIARLESQLNYKKNCIIAAKNKLEGARDTVSVLVDQLTHLDSLKIALSAPYTLEGLSQKSSGISATQLQEEQELARLEQVLMQSRDHAESVEFGPDTPDYNERLSEADKAMRAAQEQYESFKSTMGGDIDPYAQQALTEIPQFDALLELRTGYLATLTEALNGIDCQHLRQIPEMELLTLLWRVKLN
ncbi:MAG: hypothetical protein O3A01_06625 [bacterium]|nr:hypothetical protein [bacterium]